MGRDGRGNAWRYRQRYGRGGMFGRPRVFGPRTLKDEAQFSFEELYISPFKWKRQYTVEGVMTYVELQRKAPTGIRMMDEYLRFLSEGNSDLQAFAEAHGLRREDIDSMVFILTGMRGIDFRQKFQVRMADDLLRYTDLTVADVALHAGLGTAYNLYLTYKREFNIAPGRRRSQIREDRDVGRYKI